MVDSGHGRRRRRSSPVISPVLRPRLWAALLGAVAAAVLSAPAYAEPALPTTVPDSGSRPVAAGGLQLPGGQPGAGTPVLPGAPGAPATPVVNLATGPLAMQINTAQTQLGLLGDQLLTLEQQRTEAQSQLATATQNLELARQALTEAQRKVDVAAADTLKAAAALPSGEFGQDLHELGQLQRIARGDKVTGASTATSGELTRARNGERVAVEAFTAAESRAKGAQTQFATVEQQRRTQETQLLKLRKDNAAQLVQIERQQDAAEQRLGTEYVNAGSGDGATAHPRAMAAVRYALAQRGDPYVWGAEGPDTFDCSGLVWAAYRSKGADYFDLPRVARDQYNATRSRTVGRSDLLPGDLVFFASGSSWQSIHHMGMYIGDGRMVHAPTTGDVVKISPVGWSRLYAATRVIGAVPGKPTPAPVPPAPKPPKPPAPKPTPEPSTPPKPIPTPTTKPTPTPTTPPTTKPPVTPSPSTTPTTPAPTPTPTESESPSPSVSASSTPTPQGSGESAAETPTPAPGTSRAD
ncbi:C40 family peptidase [Micromonospora yangpuensis]|uniref:NlpC/P60 family protein n=1 Tax=Micromonospora yangpuensis TaxID=683228 RepID=A0A1C6TZJ0_9ACTN|nr:C40 family peptidase [Micromonospora yangpuensis]SCL47068.1 NlpC/P60 family protein [Micromonospora yangpuensis]